MTSNPEWVVRYSQTYMIFQDESIEYQGAGELSGIVSGNAVMIQEKGNFSRMGMVDCLLFRWE
eukprot:4406312-Karenia_brevis.AAC.1